MPETGTRLKPEGTTHVYTASVPTHVYTASVRGPCMPRPHSHQQHLVLRTHLLEVERVEVQAGRPGGEQRLAHLRAVLHPEGLDRLLVVLSLREKGRRGAKRGIITSEYVRTKTTSTVHEVFVRAYILTRVRGQPKVHQNIAVTKNQPKTWPELSRVCRQHPACRRRETSPRSPPTEPMHPSPKPMSQIKSAQPVDDSGRVQSPHLDLFQLGRELRRHPREAEARHLLEPPERVDAHEPRHHRHGDPPSE